jgi:hypothetical protein
MRAAQRIGKNQDRSGVAWASRPPAWERPAPATMRGQGAHASQNHSAEDSPNREVEAEKPQLHDV